MTTKPIRIAICQFDSHQPTTTGSTLTSLPEGLNLSSSFAEHEIKNLSKAKEFITRAAQNHADLIIFPEYFITGVIENHLHLASKESKWIKEFQSLAIEHQIDIIPGTIVEEEENDDNLLHPPNLFNSAYYVDKSGHILGKYRKKNLWHAEKYLTPCPKTNHVFEALGGLRIGMLICWDLAWPEAFRDLMKQNADMIIVPSFWTLDQPESKMVKHDPTGINEANLIDGLVTSRALESEACVIFVKLICSSTSLSKLLDTDLFFLGSCGGKKEEGFLGRSSISLPLKGHVANFVNPDEELRIVDVDLSVLEDAREVYKVREEYCFKSF